MTAWLFIAPILLLAQPAFKLTGKITAANGKQMEGAAIYLNRVKDTALIKTAVTDSTGSYLFSSIPAGDYLITATMVGYEVYKSSVIILHADTTLSVITLSQTGASLKTVMVTTQRPLVQHLIDRTVVNADALISSSGGTAMDVLEKSPGVMIDQNGGISLQGKSGVTVFIDDKPTYLSGDDLANYLRSLPSSGIDRVELMTTPPAGYDAAGNAGIINIRTKKIKEKGFNGNATTSWAQGVYGRSNTNLNINYRHNKLNVAATLGYMNMTNFNAITLNRYFDESITSLSPNFNQTSFVKRTWQNYLARASVDYYATEKTTIGTVLSAVVTPTNSRTTNTSLLSNAQKQPDSTIDADNKEQRHFTNEAINLNYRHAYDKKGTQHTVDFDYINYHTAIDQHFLNTGYYPSGTLYNEDLVTGNLPSTINIFSAKTDFTHPFAKDGTFSAGLKTSYTQTDNTANYFNTVNAVTTPDYDKTNHFIYKENINAAYVNTSKSFRQLSIQAGLRFENTIANGHQLGNAAKPDSTFNRNYNGLFPTLYVQYKLDSGGRQQLTFDYGRRIDRPYYAALNPFLAPLDKFTYNAGNPFLLPTYSNNYHLRYTINNISAGIFYTYIKDKSDGLIQIINGYYYNRPGNLGNTYIAGAELDGSFDATKWFNVQLYARFILQRTVSNFYTGRLDTKGHQFFTRPALTFKPGKNFTIQADGYYQGKLPNEQFVDAARWAVNVAVSDKISSAITMRLVVNDIFYSNAAAWDIGYLAGTRANFYSIGDSRNIVFTFTYRFGKAIQNQRKHDANGAQSEQNRAGN